MNRYLIPLLGFIVLVGFLGVGLNLGPHKIPSPLLDKPAPAFALPTLHDAQKIISAEQLLGEVWLLNVWASWCVACRAEHPLIVALAEGNVNKGNATEGDLTEGDLTGGDLTGGDLTGGDLTRGDLTGGDLTRGKAITLVGLNYKNQRGEALDWLAQFGDPYHHIAYDLSGDVGIDYGVYAVPESFLVDKKGYIRFKQIGPFNQQIITEQLLPLIALLQNEAL